MAGPSPADAGRRRGLPGARLGAAERTGAHRHAGAGEGGARRRSRPRDLLERTLGEYEIGTVFHLAAQTIVGIANRNPVSTFESNIQGTWNLLEACRRSPLVKSIVIASSDKAYGDQENLPYDGRRAAAGAASLRRQQVLRRPDRADLCGDLRAAGGGDALRQFLRRRRSELEPHRAGHDSLGAARRAAGDPLRRPVRARLFLRGGRRGGLHAAGGTAPLPARTAAARRSISRTRSKSRCSSWCTASWSAMGSDLEPDVRNEASTKSATSI